VRAATVMWLMHLWRLADFSTRLPDQVFQGVGRTGTFTWTALLTVKDYPYHEKVIAEHDAAWADGVEVWPQVSCRPLVFQMNLSEPFTLNMRPTFAALMGKSKSERVAAYRDPSWRATAWEDVSGQAGGFPLNWAAISVAESRTHPELADHPVAVLAEERGCTPLDVMLDVSLDDDLEARFWSVLANDDPEAIAWLLPRDNVLLGLADSGAHVSQLCDACFSTDLLGNWVRERGVMPLERAIHKLTPTIMIVTTVMVMVASTLISGLTPSRTFENTTMGRVLLPGPDVKLEITRSSHDRVKASSHPDRMAGKMMGSVMTKNTLTGSAPRSMAASSSERSISCRRALRTTAA